MVGTEKAAKTVRVLKMWHFSDLNITKKDGKQKEEPDTRKRPLSQNFVIIKRCSPASPNEVKRPRDENVSNFNVKEVVKVKMELCRICLKQGTTPIHGDSSSEDLAGAINTFGGIDITIFDSLPKYLCESCRALLQGAILFRKTAQATDQLFKKSTVPDDCKSDGTAVYNDAHKLNLTQTAQIDSNMTFDNSTEPEPEIDDHFSDFPVDIVGEVLSILEPQVCLKTTQDFDLFEKPNPPKSARIASTSESIVNVNKAPSLLKQNNLTCKQCEIQFNSVQDYKNHKLNTRKHKKKRCTVCKQTNAVWYTKKVKKTTQKTEGTYVCDICYGNIEKVFKKPVKTIINQQPPTGTSQQQPTGTSQHPPTTTSQQPPNILKPPYFSNNFAMEGVSKAFEEKKVVLTCKQCDIKFDKFQHYREHRLQARKHKKKMCAVCNSTYATRYIKKYGTTNNMTDVYVCNACYRKDSNKLVREITDETPSSFVVRKLKLNCKQCNLAFISFREYKFHIFAHRQTRKMCPICNQSISGNYYTKHMQNHKEGPAYVCDICGKHFNRRYDFKLHSGTHMKSFPYKCSLCSYKTLLQNSLKIHMRSHSGERPYLCEQCPKKFVTKSNLIKHRYTHKKECDFVCDCGKGYHTKKELEVHFKVDHVGLKEHICQICGKAYGLRKVLMRHQLRVHKREKLRGGKQPTYLKFESMKEESNVSTA